MKSLGKYGVKTFEELDNKDWGDYFLKREARYDDMSPEEGGRQLVEKVELIDQYIREMNRVREEHRMVTQRSLVTLREKRRNEKLFTGRFKELAPKPEFKSRVNQL